MLNPIELGIPRHDLSLRDPPRHLLPESGNVVWVHVLIGEDEPLDGDPTSENLSQVLDAVLLVDWFVVL